MGTGREGGVKMVGVRRREGGRSSEDGPGGGVTDSRTGTKEKSRRFPEVLTLPALVSHQEYVSDCLYTHAHFYIDICLLSSQFVYIGCMCTHDMIVTTMMT